MCSACGSNGGSCPKLVKKLRTQKNNLVTLWKTETDVTKKNEYKALTNEVAVKLNNADNVCPDSNLIEGLRIYITNEYNKRAQP